MEKNKISIINMELPKIIIFIILVLIILLLSYLIINKSNLIVKYKGIKSYDFLYPKSFVSENIDQCPKGCIRGVCDKDEVNGNCLYDYQCSYCADEETNRFYVDFDGRDEILNDYNKNNTNKKEKSLNNKIEENNEYIDELNDQIKDLNS